MDEEAHTKQIVLDAYKRASRVVIYYQDAWDRRTSRMIEPLELETIHTRG
jgi:predicted DNA-binding transcriptional regulator YafY